MIFKESKWAGIIQITNTIKEKLLLIGNFLGKYKIKF